MSTCLVNESSASSRVPSRRLRQRRFPTQIVSNGEYLPPRRAQHRRGRGADQRARRPERQALGLSRRQFLHTSCGMAAAFLAMKTSTAMFPGRVSRAREPELMLARAQGLAGQFIFESRPISCATTSITRSSGFGGLASQNWNPKMKEGRLVARPLQVQNYVKRFIRQRYQHGALERRTVRRSSLVACVQRADRQRRASSSRLRGFAPSAGAQRHHPQAARLDGGGPTRQSMSTSRFLEGLHDRRSAGTLQVSMAAR